MIVELEFGNGTEEKAIFEEKANSFCLTDEHAIEIASIGAAVSICRAWKFRHSNSGFFGSVT